MQGFIPTRFVIEYTVFKMKIYVFLPIELFSTSSIEILFDTDAISSIKNGQIIVLFLVFFIFVNVMQLYANHNSIDQELKTN